MPVRYKYCWTKLSAINEILLYPESLFPLTGGWETRNLDKVWFEVWKKIKLPVKLCKPSWQKHCSFKTLVFYFHLSPFFLKKKQKTIKSKPASELLKVVCFVKLVQEGAKTRRTRLLYRWKLQDNVESSWTYLQISSASYNTNIESYLV